MANNLTILIAEDDQGHADLIRRNLQRCGVTNQMIHFSNGQEILDFLFVPVDNSKRSSCAYVLLLDIRMPKIDGVEVLRRIKNRDTLKSMPVIMLTTTDDPREVKRCHELGCNNYISKPIDYDNFIDTLQRLGAFLGIMQVPNLYEKN